MHVCSVATQKWGVSLLDLVLERIRESYFDFSSAFHTAFWEWKHENRKKTAYVCSLIITEFLVVAFLIYYLADRLRLK